MSKSVVVTARISEETLALVDRLAAAKDRSRAWIVARAIEAQAKAEIEFLDFVQVGIDDIEAGRVHTQEEVEAWFEARYETGRDEQVAAAE